MGCAGRPRKGPKAPRKMRTRWLWSRRELHGMDPHVRQREPLWAGIERAKAQRAARRRDGVLVVDPRHETQRARWRIGRDEQFVPVYQEAGRLAAPFHRVVVPVGEWSG